MQRFDEGLGVGWGRGRECGWRDVVTAPQTGPHSFLSAPFENAALLSSCISCGCGQFDVKQVSIRL